MVARLAENCAKKWKSYASLQPFYDAVIGPIVDLLESQFDEGVIVSDGALCLTPWTAIFESIRIRTLPSLTSYQLISSLHEGHHKKAGALLVGNPCLNDLEKPLPDSPCAHEDVDCLLYTSPSPRDA